MSTVAQVIDRMYREYLHPASSQPTRATLNGALNNSDTTIPFNLTGILTPEELDLLGEGVIIEIGSEHMLVTAWSSPNATVIRGWGDTAAAAHSDNDIIYLAPQFSRLQVFDGVADAIVDLYPDLYAQKTRPLTTSQTPIDIDPATVEVRRVVYDDGGRLVDGDFEFIEGYGNPKLQLSTDVPSGKTAYVTYRSKFPRPTAESDDLDDTDGDWAMPEEWMKIIMIDALALMVASRQADHLNVDFIVKLLNQQEFDISESRQVIGGLIGLREEYVRRAKTRLRAKDRVRVIHRR